MARALVVQHTGSEGLGWFQEWLPAAGLDVHPIHPYLGHRVPTSGVLPTRCPPCTSSRISVSSFTSTSSVADSPVSAASARSTGCAASCSPTERRATVPTLPEHNSRRRRTSEQQPKRPHLQTLRVLAG